MSQPKAVEATMHIWTRRSQGGMGLAIAVAEPVSSDLLCDDFVLYIMGYPLQNGPRVVLVTVTPLSWLPFLRGASIGVGLGLRRLYIKPTGC